MSPVASTKGIVLSGRGTETGGWFLRIGDIAGVKMSEGATEGTFSDGATETEGTFSERADTDGTAGGAFSGSLTKGSDGPKAVLDMREG